MAKLLSGSHEYAAAVFAIGKALVGNVNVARKSIFGVRRSDFSPGLAAAASQAITHYQMQLQACKLAVFTWTHVGIRLKVVKDIRKMIGEKIWQGRAEASYQVTGRK